MRAVPTDAIRERRTKEAQPRPGARGPGSGEHTTPPIQSLQRGLTILEMVASRDAGITLAEISRETGLHTSTAFHLVRTLTLLGYLAQSDSNRRYRLGPKIFQLGTRATHESHLADVAAPFLREMSRATGETAHLAILVQNEVIVIGKVDGESHVRLAERVGYPRPAHCTAIGKVLLAYLSEEDRQMYLGKARLERHTAKTITSAPQLAQELVKVREQEFAIDDEEFAQGIRCIAAPVRALAGRVVAAVGISGSIWQVSLERVGQLTNVLMATASELSAQLGYETLADTQPVQPA